jgi:hypothetical protein
MKNIFTGFAFLLFFVFTQNCLQAQYDTIVYVNGTKQAAKIIEITKKVVRFKNPKDTLGPTFIVNIKNIERFILKDGCIDLKTEGYLNCVKDPTFGAIKNEDFTKNIISMDFLQLTNEHLQVSYEHIFKNRKLGIVGYYNQGLLDGTDTSIYSRWEIKMNNSVFYKQNYGGLDFKYYPTIHKRNTFWVALGVEAGRVIEKVTFDQTAQKSMNGFIAMQTANGGYTYYSNTNYVTYYSGASTISMVNRFFMGYHFSSGFLFRINKHFIWQGNLSAGLNQFSGLEGYKFSLKASAGLLLGYAF